MKLYSMFAALVAVSLSLLVVPAGAATSKFPTNGPCFGLLCGKQAKGGAPTLTNANPIAAVQTITVEDLQNALNDATSQTPPDERHAQCWAALIPFVQNYNATSILPTSPGLALLAQKTFDLQQTAGKPLIPDNVVTACALTFSDLQLDVAKIAGLLGIHALTIPALPAL